MGATFLPSGWDYTPAFDTRFGAEPRINTAVRDKTQLGAVAADPPSDSVVLERAFSLANEALLTVALQRRRSRSTEPEDTVLIFRWWVDIQFLIVALRRLRRAAELASRVPCVEKEVSAALKDFNDSLPALAAMRNVGEHIDEYALDSDRCRDKRVSRTMLQVGMGWTTYEWLVKKLNVDEAHSAAVKLHSAIRAAVKSLAASKSGA
jgi:hypothetical protein